MALQTQNKISPSFSATSMSDLVFLLLIFFMITSTLVAPNAINISLPKSSSGRVLGPRNIEVYVDANKNYFLTTTNHTEPEPVTAETLLPALLQAATVDKSESRTIILRSDATVPVQNIVTLWDILNKLNENLAENQKYRLIFATESESK
jgi:biopolymer transport protein ExbD